MPTNKYGMPSGGYAQRAQAAKALSTEEQGQDLNPITSVLAHKRTPQGSAQASTDADPLSAVTRNGQPNLQAVPPPMVTPQVQPVQSALNPNPTANPLNQQALQTALGAPPQLKGRYTNGDSDVPDASKVLTNAYQTYLGRAPEGDVINQDLRGQGWGGQPDGRIGAFGLNSLVNDIYNSPEANTYRTKIQHPAAPPSTTASGGVAPTAAYLQSLIAGGMSPQDAAAAFNKNTGRSTGNEAVYYDPSQHGGHATIGLPDAYLTDEDGWKGATTRSPEGPSQGGGNNSQLSALMSSLAGGTFNGNAFGNTNYPQQLLQQLMQSLATQNALFK